MLKNIHILPKICQRIVFKEISETGLPLCKHYIQNYNRIFDVKPSTSKNYSSALRVFANWEGIEPEEIFNLVWNGKLNGQYINSWFLLRAHAGYNPSGLGNAFSAFGKMFLECNKFDEFFNWSSKTRKSIKRMFAEEADGADILKTNKLKCLLKFSDEETKKGTIPKDFAIIFRAMTGYMLRNMDVPTLMWDDIKENKKNGITKQVTLFT